MPNKKKTITLKPYKSYRFVNRDPEMERLRQLALDKGYGKSALSLGSGVSASTFANWWGTKRHPGSTRRPQNASIEAAGRAMGMMREWVRMPDKKA